MSSTDDDQIELDEHIEFSKSKDDQQSVNSKLIQQPDTGEPLKITSKRKDLIVHFEELSKFRLCLNRMSKAKNVGFLVVLVIAVLITFGITRYATNKHESSKCTKEKDAHPEYSPKNVTKVNRLPTTISPIHYKLNVQPFIRPDQFYFNGSVSILVHCKESTDTIQLNANELDINRKWIVVSQLNSSDESETRLNVSSVELKNEVLTLRLDKKLNQNENYTIFIPFTGNLTTSLSGFYRSSYKDVQSNQTRYVNSEKKFVSYRK